MATNNNEFAIDDMLGTAENLAVFAQLLETLDEQLGAALRPYLAPLAAGQKVDTVAIWDTLYAATAPLDPVTEPPGGRAGGEETIA